MPLTTTHALVPLAGAVAFSRKPLSPRLLLAACVAASIPDLDVFAASLYLQGSHLAGNSIYTHRGAAHSLFLAIAIGLIATIFHKHLRVTAMVAGLVVGSSMATHGLLDMLTNSGAPVAYLWPVSSVRLFGDWRPISSWAVHSSRDLFARQWSEVWQVIIPMFIAALLFRAATLVFEGRRHSARL